MIDLNAAEPTPPQYDADDLSARLAERAAEWVPGYFPRGLIDKRGDTLRLANIRGAPPSKDGSCVINLRGEHAGAWYDHSTGQGGQALSTLAEATGLRGVDLFQRAAEIVGSSAAPTARNRPRRTTEEIGREVQFTLGLCTASLAGTLGETYLRNRIGNLPAGIEHNSDLRFHDNLTDWEAKRGRPGIIAVIRDPVTGAPTGGIHRTYLADDGSAKADMVKPKMMLGPSSGIVMLMPMREDGVLGIGEGIETSLAAERIFGVPVWAALSAGNMRHMGFPPGLRRLLVFADRGDDGEASAFQLKARAIEAGIAAEVMFPVSNDDFAEDLRQGLQREVPLLPPPDPQRDPVLMPPQPNRPSGSTEVLAAAQACGKDDARELERILRACGPLDPFARRLVFDVLKKTTRIGHVDLGKMVQTFAKQEQMARYKRPWLPLMQCYEWGEPRAILANVLIALREETAWRGVIGLDEFRSDISVLRRLPFDDMPGGDFPRQWTDNDGLRLTEWLQRCGLHVGPEIVQQAVRVIADENAFHPVRDWLTSLEWDGVPRIDLWLQNYAGAQDSEYTRAVGARFLVSSVARVHQPGCKVDHAMVLEAAQGGGKSTLLRVLFDPWFTDEIADLGTKDSALQLRGVWGIELAELDAMDRTEIRRIKAFLSRTNDRYRPPYGMAVVDVPRQCVFAGSTNEQDYLRDPTGGRRFWPIRCPNRLDYTGAYAAREQLWAEAAARFHAGEIWFLREPALIAAAAAEQAERYQEDAWAAPIAEYLERRFPANQWRSTEHDEVAIGEILEHALLIEKGRWTPKEQSRVACCLRASGWLRAQRRLPGHRRQWVYRREVTYDEQN